VALTAGDTEGDCLCRALPALPREAHAYFGELIAAWVTAAYAGRLPGAERAQALTAAWSVHFARAAA
jgi:hypothetical protein